MKDIRASNNFNSFLKQLWVEYCVGEGRDLDFKHMGELVDRVLLFINPDGFDKYNMLRENPALATRLTEDNFKQLTGRTPDLKVDMRPNPNAKSGANS